MPETNWGALNNKSCLNCRWWDVDDLSTGVRVPGERVAGGNGRCVFHAPNATSQYMVKDGPDLHWRGVWALTDSDDWCRDWTDKDAADQEAGTLLWAVTEIVNGIVAGLGGPL